jgi:hypothetical protein
MGTRLRCELHHSSAHVAYTDIVLTVGGGLLNGPVSGGKAPAVIETNPQQAGEIRVGPAVSANLGMGTIGVEGGVAGGQSITDVGASPYVNLTLTPTTAPVIPNISIEAKVNLIEFTVKSPTQKLK